MTLKHLILFPAICLIIIQLYAQPIPQAVEATGAFLLIGLWTFALTMNEE